MKEAVDKILENKDNIGLDFVVHVRDEDELNGLIDVLMKRGFHIQLSLEFSPEQLDLWMRDIAKTEGFDLYFRIRNRKEDKCVAYNPSVEHWKAYCNDILEMNNGKLENLNNLQTEIILDKEYSAKVTEEEMMTLSDAKPHVYKNNEYNNQQWIPVEQRLPSNDGYILLSFSNFSVPAIGRYEGDNDIGGNFYIGDEDATCLSQDMYVNAWQPLPQPYRV